MPISFNIQPWIIQRLTLQSSPKTINAKPKGIKYLHPINNHLKTSSLKRNKNHTKKNVIKNLLQVLKSINNECPITNQNISFFKHKSFSLANNLNW
jgi:hypothetical protein